MLLRPWLADLLTHFTWSGRKYRRLRLRRTGWTETHLACHAEVLETRTVLSAGDAPLAGLIANWTGNGDANDSSGNGHNGTLVNGAGFGSGQFDQQAFQLDGVNQYVSVPDSSAWDFGNNPFRSRCGLITTSYRRLRSLRAETFSSGTMTALELRISGFSHISPAEISDSTLMGPMF